MVNLWWICGDFVVALWGIFGRFGVDQFVGMNIREPTFRILWK